LSIFNFSFSSSVQKIREHLALLLLVLLPFHALFVTVVTKLIAGSGHAPLTILALWKEGLLGVILVMALVELALRTKSRVGLSSPANMLRYGLRSGAGLLSMTQRGVSKARLDLPDALIIALIILAIPVTFLQRDLGDFLLGFKYDFVPLVAFLILRRVEWSPNFMKKAMDALLIVGCIVAGFGVISYVLPQSFFTLLGYSDLHSLYLADGPLAPFQQIGGLGLRRLQATMSGPNQLGLWLLLPFSIALLHVVEAIKNQHMLAKKTAILLVILGAIFFTFSRSAWVATGVITFIVLYRHSSKPIFWRMSVAAGVLLLIIGITAASLAPNVLVRLASSRGHIERPIEALMTMIAHPFGLGLGSAGPASNRTSDTCVQLDAGSDATWAQAHPNLCVFVAHEQVQPMGKTCNCPLLTENWYLQIGVELGWVGFVLFVSLIFFIILLVSRGVNPPANAMRLVALLFLVGICIAGLFLHAWEDAAVAYTVWILVAVALHAKNGARTTVS